VDVSDILNIGALLGPGEPYVMQQFRATFDLIDAAYAGVRPYSADTIRSFADSVRPLVGSVTMRGL